MGQNPRLISPLVSMNRINRIDALFDCLRIENRAAMVAYITGGDPSLEASAEVAVSLGQSGVDILELGIPFSDPLADGATIQAAAGRAIAAGATVAGILGMIREIRRHSDMPIVLFTYLNPVYTYGYERFQQDAAAAGADWILLLDLPPSEASQNQELAASTGLRTIRLIAPTTPEERLQEITDASEGFIYYVSREGVTGEQSNLASDIAARVATIRALTKVPVAVGFGISNPEQAAAVAALADGVVVGSAIVRRIGEIGNAPDLPARIADFVRPIAEAVHGVKR